MMNTHHLGNLTHTRNTMPKIKLKDLRKLSRKTLSNMYQQAYSFDNFDNDLKNSIAKAIRLNDNKWIIRDEDDWDRDSEEY